MRANRILAIVGTHRERVFLEAAVNICNAARASAGINVTRAVLLEEPLEMDSTYSPAGTALGNIAGFEHLCAAIYRHAGTFDAVAISSMVSVAPEIHDRYFHEVAVINPYGGVEAMLTHAVSCLYDLPTAHAPMYEDWERWNQSAGIMDPRLAAEGISLPFLFSALKGLRRSPRIVPVTPGQDFEAGTYTAADVDCLVLPEGCLGLPVMAAIAQSIPIIFVRDDTNMAKNSIEDLASAGADVRLAHNYLEAAGMVCALRAGIHLDPKPMPLDGASALRPDLEVTGSKAI